MANKFGLKKISSSISKEKFGGAIQPNVIYNVIKLLISEISYSLLNDIPVTVKNFGTLSQWLVKGHKAGYWSDGLHQTQDTKRIRFYAHTNFSQLIQYHREDFEKKD